MAPTARKAFGLGLLGEVNLGLGVRCNEPLARLRFDREDPGSLTAARTVVDDLATVRTMLLNAHDIHQAEKRAGQLSFAVGAENLDRHLGRVLGVLIANRIEVDGYAVLGSDCLDCRMKVGRKSADICAGESCDFLGHFDLLVSYSQIIGIQE